MKKQLWYWVSCGKTIFWKYELVSQHQFLLFSPFSHLSSYFIHCLWEEIWHLPSKWALEQGMATHRSILASRIPWTEEPGGLQFMRVTKSWTQLKLLSMHASKWATVCSWPAFHPQLSQYLQLKGRGKSVDEQDESLELHHSLRLQDGTGLGKKERCRQSDEYLCS